MMGRRVFVAGLPLATLLTGCATDQAQVVTLIADVATAARLADDVLAVLPFAGVPPLDVAAAGLAVKVVTAELDLFIKLEPGAVATWRAGGRLLGHVLDVYARYPRADRSLLPLLRAQAAALASLAPADLFAALTALAQDITALRAAIGTHR